MALTLEGDRFTWHARQTGYENICATRSRGSSCELSFAEMPPAPADRGNGCEWVDQGPFPDRCEAEEGWARRCFGFATRAGW
jgi:hypothetical protein